MYRRSLFSALITLLVIECVVSLKCYECDSQYDPECMEKFDHSAKEDLFLQPTDCKVNGGLYCIKTTGIYGGVVGTRRFCSSRDFTNACQFVTYPHHDRVYWACAYTCTSDGCNGSSTVTTSFLFTCSLVFLLFLKLFIKP